MLRPVFAKFIKALWFLTYCIPAIIIINQIVNIPHAYDFYLLRSVYPLGFFFGIVWGIVNALILVVFFLLSLIPASILLVLAWKFENYIVKKVFRQSVINFLDLNSYKSTFENWKGKKTDHITEINVNDHYLLQSKLQSLEEKADEKFIIKDYPSTIGICDMILKVKPNNYDTLINRAMSLENLGFYLDAIDDYEHAIKIDTDYNIYGLLGICYSKVGKLQNAVTKLQLAVENGFELYKPTYDMFSKIMENKGMNDVFKEKASMPENLKRKIDHDFVFKLSETDSRLYLSYLKELIYNGERTSHLLPENHELRAFYEGLNIEFLRMKEIEFINSESTISLHPLTKASENIESYLEFEEFLYQSTKMILENRESVSIKHIKSFISNIENNEKMILIEIRYLMLAILNCSARQIYIEQNKISKSNIRAIDRIDKCIYKAVERNLLTNFTDIDLSIDLFNVRKDQYDYYLAKYEYAQYERSYVEAFTTIMNGEFEAEINYDIDSNETMLLADWIFKTYGEATILNFKRQNFVL